MTPDSAAAGSGHSVGSARCVLFAYHEAGYACMEALLGLGAPITGLFTHRDALDEVRRCAPDVIYAAYYRSLIPPALLALAPLGAYNLHGSMLPKYRGRVPVNWMLVNGETEGGVTLHHMVTRADAGDIVAQRAIGIDDSDTALTLYRKLIPLWAALINEYHPLIVAGRAPRRAQDLSRGSYYGRRRPEDGRIDWRWPARRIFNLVRAVTHPYPGAFCFVGGGKLLVWEAKIGAENGSLGEPGRVVRETADGALEIAAGEGSVILKIAQFEGGAEGIAREALSRIGRVKDTILFD